MECEICSKKISINWGGAEHILCEEHCNNIGNLPAISKRRIENKPSPLIDDKPSISSYLGLIFLLLINLLGLPIWFVFMISGSNGVSLEDTVFLPITLYPLFIIVFSLISFGLNAMRKGGKAVIFMLLPLIISGSYIFLIGIINNYK